MSDGRLYELTATEIASFVRSSHVRAEEVAQSFLERTRQLDQQIRAWVCVDQEYVKSQASTIDLSKPQKLVGVPIGIKDIFNTEFYPTQKGSPAWEGYKAGNDARCVSYLRWEGGIIFGKTDTSELAVHANGKARNPHSLSHVTGSSSGGSAAAVATAMVPVALGSQTGGSTIRPASWCGVYAMKPSFGLIPRTGVLKTTDTLDTIGFFGRSVDDLELMLQTLRVRGENFPIHEEQLGRLAGPVSGKWRIAFCSHHFSDCTEEYVNRSLAQLRRDLSATPGVEVVELSLPASTRQAHALHRRIYHPDLGYYLRSEMKRARDKVSEILVDVIEDSKTIPPEDYATALQEQASLADDLARFFATNRIDAVFTNSSVGSAPVEKEPPMHKDVNPLWTLAWLPVINVPQFKCPAGLPFGLQVVGQKFADLKLFALLRHLERHELIPSRAEIVSPPFCH